MSLVRGLFKNAAWITIGQVSSKLLRALFLALAARFLGLGNYGIVTFALAQSGFFIPFADCGVAQFSMRECAYGDEQKRKATALQGLFTKIILITGTAFLLAVTMLLSRSQISLTPSIIAFVIAIFACDSLKDYTTGLMLSQEKNRIEAYITIISNLIPIATGIPLLVIYQSPLVFLGAYTGASVLALLLDLLYLKRIKLLSRATTTINTLTQKFHAMIRTLTQSYVFGLHSLTTFLMYGFDTILIGFFLNEHSVALYSAAQRIPLLVVTLLNSVTQGFFPELSRSAFEDREKMAHLLNKALSFFVLTSIPIFLGSQLVAPEFITAIFGSDYSLSVNTFRMLMVMCLCTLPSTLYTFGFYALHRQRFVVVVNFVIGGLTVIGDLIVINYAGIIGCALVTALLQGAQSIILSTYLQKEVRLSITLPWAQFLTALVLMTFVTEALLSMGLSIIFVIMGAVVTYGFSTFTAYKKLIHT